MQYQTRTMMFGGGMLTPAVKFLLIANTAVFFLQLFLPSEILPVFTRWALSFALQHAGALDVRL
jgi:hypothetical protein